MISRVPLRKRFEDIPQGKIVIEDVEDGGNLLERGSRGQRRGKGGQRKLTSGR